MDSSREAVERWLADAQNLYAGYLEPDKVRATIRALLNAIDELEKQRDRALDAAESSQRSARAFQQRAAELEARMPDDSPR